MIKRATDINPYLAMLVGIGVTILVQSSSITTSVLTPLVGMDIIKLEQMLPLTLGANIGTTGTALLASMVSDKPESVQIALCHLFFNIFGILIWFPAPFMRQFPLRAARQLRWITRQYKAFPAFYILFMFVVAPGIFLGISQLFTTGGAYVVIGVFLLIALSLMVIRVLYFFVRQDGWTVFAAKLQSWQKNTEFKRDLMGKVEALEEKVRMLESGKGGAMTAAGKATKI
jgi:sodium-dependent phosphate cotransporter